MKTQMNSNAPEGCAPLSCYASFWGKLLRKWDWWIYCRAHKSLWRLCEAEPAYGYLMELQLQRWNARKKLPDSLKRSTELFHDSLVESRHNAEVSRGNRERQPDTHSTDNQP